MKAKRPKKFFDPKGKMPPEVTLELHRPPGWEHLSEDEWVELLRSRVELKEQQIRDKRERERIKLPGRKALLSKSPDSQATSRKPHKRAPRVAASTPERRFELLERIKQFVRSYYEAYKQRREGDVDVLFPFGTYQLRRLRLVNCDEAPAPA